MAETTTANKQARPILIGSIIHLRNVLPKEGEYGGYLDTGTRVKEDVAERFKNDPRIRMYVSTHAKEDRSDGSGSWKILSADGKHNGEQLLVGDNIYLQSVYQDAGFLDSFEWVKNLKRFKQYAAMQQGVFTFSIRNRGGGVTSIWTVKAAASKPDSIQIVAGDAIYLENAYTDAGYLHTYGKITDHKATDSKEFEGLDGQFFVFTAKTPLDANKAQAVQLGSHKWSVSLSKLGNEHLYNVYDADLLQGRNNNMQVVTNVTEILLRDAFQSFGGVTIATVETLMGAQVIDAVKEDLKTLLGSATSGVNHSPSAKFQIKQLLNLYKLSKLLKSFDTDKLQKSMRDSLKNHQDQWTFPPLHLFRQCFRQTATDHEIIQRATTQRRWDAEKNRRAHAEELWVTDKLAARAIAPFKHLLPGTPDQLAIITYFSEATHIHHLPYSNNFVLVGVSYDRVPSANSGPTDSTDSSNDKNASAFELMAIPHEVGHYMYQYGQLADGTTFAKLSEQFQGSVYYRWCEEIFADLYGCVVAGPLAAMSIQALLMSTDKDRALKDDEHHPTPMLRPYIMSEMLRILSRHKADWYPFSKSTKLLDDTWTITLDGWGYGKVQDDHQGNATRIYLPEKSALQVETVVNVDRVISAIRPMITEFAKQLIDSLVKVDPNQKLVPWSQTDSMRRDSYYHEMVSVMGKVANDSVECPVLLNLVPDESGADESDPDQCLRQYVVDWGDSGPIGSSGGTHRLVSFPFFSLAI